MPRGSPKFKIDRNLPPRILVAGLEIRRWLSWSPAVFTRHWSRDCDFPFPINYRPSPWRGRPPSAWKVIAQRERLDFLAARPKNFRLYWDGREVAAHFRKTQGDGMANIFLEQLWVASDLDPAYQEQVRQVVDEVKVGRKPCLDEVPKMPAAPVLPKVKGGAV